jgi:hypothetical protein
MHGLCKSLTPEFPFNLRLTSGFSPAIIGTAIIYSIPPNHSNRVGLLIAFYCTQFYLAEGNLIFSLISRNIAGQTKKSTTLAITFVAWAAGNMTAPQVCLTLPSS